MKHLIRALFAILLLTVPAYASSGSETELMNLTGVAVTTTGATKLLPPKANHFLCAITAANVSGGTPTLAGVVQYSVDGVSTHWKDLCTFTSITTSTDAHEIVHVDYSAAHVYPRVRAKVTLGGTTPVYNVAIKMYYQIGD